MTDEVVIQSLTDKVNFINKEVKRTGNNLADLIVCMDAEVLVHALNLIQRLQSENAGLQERGEIVINSLHETIDKQKTEIEQLKDEFKTDYRNSWKNKFFSVLKENRELQKQVDELKEENKKLYKENTTLIAGSILERKDIAKDTAKEIYDKCIAIDKATGCKGFVCIEAIAELSKDKGVEVE